MSNPTDVKTRVLIADDDKEVRAVLQDFLSDYLDCVAVDCAEGALSLMQEEQFPVVLSDVQMNGMTGLELVPQVLGRAPDTQVILVSGSQDVDNVIEALRVGAFDYITKPFDLRELDATVRRAVEHYELRVAKRRYENHLKELVEQRTAALDRALSSLEDAYRVTLKALVAALEARDLETHGHSERVVSFSLRLSLELELNDQERQALEFGSLLHDIGKIGVPDAILRKPGKLTEGEWVMMRQHPTLGEQILRGINFLEGAVRVVAQHHEQWNGRGYPRCLRGEAIDLNARIFAVADAFDAMTSDRVYRRARSYEQAVKELDKFSDIQFDPQVVRAFHRVPRGEWEELRRRSLVDWQRNGKVKFTDMVALQSREVALAS